MMIGADDYNNECWWWWWWRRWKTLIPDSKDALCIKHNLNGSTTIDALSV